MQQAALLHHEETYEHRLRMNRWGLWLFLISETFLFGGLFIARLVLWKNTKPELNQGLGLFLTLILLTSSFFMNRAETAIALGHRKTFLRSLLITAVLGTVFLIGVIGFEWGLLLPEGPHILPTDGAYGAVLYGLTGFHALHVLTGIIFILIVWNLGRKGHFSPERHFGVEACAVYWHYVDLVWVFLYAALYLIGSGIPAVLCTL